MYDTHCVRARRAATTCTVQPHTRSCNARLAPACKGGVYTRLCAQFTVFCVGSQATSENVYCCGFAVATPRDRVCDFCSRVLKPKRVVASTAPASSRAAEHPKKVEKTTAKAFFPTGDTNTTQVEEEEGVTCGHVVCVCVCDAPRHTHTPNGLRATCFALSVQLAPLPPLKRFPFNLTTAKRFTSPPPVAVERHARTLAHR